MNANGLQMYLHLTKAPLSMYSARQSAEMIPPPMPYKNRVDSTNSNPFAQRDTVISEAPRKVQVFEDYSANIDDEISASVGDVIVLSEEYDDGTIDLYRLGIWYKHFDR
jgi:hypothetical protein